MIGLSAIGDNDRRDYADGRSLRAESGGPARYSSPLTTPVLFSTAIVIVVLLASRISFEDYKQAKDIMTSCWAATVALAIRSTEPACLSQNLAPAGLGLLAGSLGTMIAAALIARLFSFTPELHFFDRRSSRRQSPLLSRLPGSYTVTSP